MEFIKLFSLFKNMGKIRAKNLGSLVRYLGSDPLMSCVIHLIGLLGGLSKKVFMVQYIGHTVTT